MLSERELFDVWLDVLERTDFEERELFDVWLDVLERTDFGESVVLLLESLRPLMVF